jgi:hypothetical protein
MLRAAITLRFTGIMPRVLVIAFVPTCLEAVVVAALGRALFHLPTNLSYALGFLMAYDGIGVTVPTIYEIIYRGFKVKDLIPNILLMISLIDNLLGPTVF